MGHKRHKVIKGDFSNMNPGRGGPGITEDGYPPHLVVVSVEHPEINPKGVTIETFTEEVTEEKIFGTNVGEAIEDLINNEETNQNDNPNKEATTMNNEQNNTNEKTETINNTNNVHQENINTNNAKETVNNNNPNNKKNNMNTNNTNEENINMNNANANVNPNGTIDDGSNSNNVNQKPSLAKEAASAFVVGAAYGAGTICAVIGISMLAAGIRKMCSGDATATGDAAATAAETTETVAEAFLR